jgi:predicted ATP-dependent endonuclease of OLD family
MKIRRIQATHFLCFRSLDLAIDEVIQVVAGPNNAGKSSLVRLLETFFAGPSGPALVELLPLNAYFRDMGPRTLSTIRLTFADFQAAEAAFCTDAISARSNEMWVEIRSSKAGTVSYRASRSVGAERGQELYEYVLSRFHFAKIPSVRVGGVGDQPASMDRLFETLEAILIKSGPARRTTLQIEFGRKVDELEASVSDVLARSADAIQNELPFEGGAVRFELGEFRHALRGLLSAVDIRSDEGASVPVRDRGTGFQSALILGVLRYVAQQEAPNEGQVFFAVEEPEAFLHPQTQRAMIKVLTSVAENAQVLLTTHSPIVVDSFPITKTLRLPLDPAGSTFRWERPNLSQARQGRLTRWCNAANSELVFAKAILAVEGESDLQIAQYLLDSVAGGPNEHHVRGISVLGSGGLGNAKNLIELANHFRVPSYVLADKDGLAGAKNDRRLLDVLKARNPPPTPAQTQAMIEVADRPCATYADAVQSQTRLNELLAPFGAYVYSSDLEGFLIDTLGASFIEARLGPNGEGVLAQQFLDDLATARNARSKLGRRLGSKGWEQITKPTGKIDPHLPRLLIEDYLEIGGALPAEVRRLRRWLQNTVMAGSPAVALPV